LETIQIVTATNNEYAPHLAVMLFSLLENKKSPNPLLIYVMETDLSQANKQKLKAITARKRVKLKFIEMEKRDAPYLVFGHVSKESYYRIHIPDILPNLKKVLYLDCDMIVHDDITRLWETEVDGHFLAAVEDPAGPYRYEDLAVPEHHYFNAGVLLLNLEKWREDGISDQVMNFLSDHPDKIWWWDQDALNAILHAKWLRLDMKWNYQPFSWIPLEYPSIIHYTSQIKPWNGNPPLREYYDWYARRVKW
jgi:lipopolysaccharide biosynthesis glycosyltransferase